MKKIALVLVLALFLAVGSAFAQHPSGWGIGVLGQYGGEWSGGPGYGGIALSLKPASSSIFWGINVHIDKPNFGFSLTGDRYIIDTIFVPGVNLGFYLGLGGYAGLGVAKNYFSLGFGARLPIGLYILPVEFLEVFAGFVPRLGVDFYLGKDAPDDIVDFPATNWSVEFGIRLWL